MDTTHALLIAMLLAALLALWWVAGRTRRGNARRARVARRAEGQAELLLARHGYTIVERQAHTAWTLFIDGEPVRVTCRADLIVRKRGRDYVAEVKSGGAADPTKPNVRRQLLEYERVFDVDGVLLVDMARGRVLTVAWSSA